MTLHAVDECDITLVLSYVVSNASWSPAYDTRVFTKDKTIKVLTYTTICPSVPSAPNTAPLLWYDKAIHWRGLERC